jgi:GDP-4-dehydro-6-deoxy-D-mannose reductase
MDGRVMALHALRLDSFLAGFSFGCGLFESVRIERGRARFLGRHLRRLQSSLDALRDVVEAYRLLVEKGHAGEAYNVCSGEGRSIRALLDEMIALAGVKAKVEVDPARLRPSDNPVILGSHARLTADTGWTPVIPIEQTLADLLEHWRRSTTAV